MTEAEHAALMQWNAQWHKEQQQTMTTADLGDDDAWPMSLAVLAFFAGVLVMVVPFVVLIVTLLIGWQ